MADTVRKSNHDCRVKPANKASIVDIAASDIIIVISDGRDSEPFNSDYSEIVRALKGINLSGRLVAVISLSDKETEKALLESFEDTGITYSKTKFDNSKSKVGTWIKSILEEYKEMMDGREIS